MSQDRIIDRVRKLLALANDAAASQGERDNALRMAYATLAKHNLNMADVGSAQTQEVREQQVAQMSVYPWARGIAHSLAGLFFCSYYYSRSSNPKFASHYFVGRQSNAITANELAQYIIASVFKELRQQFKSETSPAARSFAVGVEVAIRKRCQDMRRAATNADAPTTAESVTGTKGGALVLASLYKTELEANNAWIDQNVGKLKIPTDRTKGVLSSAYDQGKKHGNSISLAPQVGVAKSNVKRLT